MAIKDHLMDELKEAMKAKDAVLKSTITMLRSAIKQVEVDQRIELDDEGVIDIIAKQLKQKQAARDEFEKGGRQDLVDETLAEMEILKKYLPEQLSEEALREMVKEAIAETGASSQKEMGKVMALLTPKTKGRADGKLLSVLVKELLG